MKYRKLFTPVKLGSITLKNRFAMAPMGPLGLGDSEGGWSQRGIDYFTARAKGGVALISSGVTFADQKVELQNQAIVPISTYNPVHFIRTSKEMTERIHAYGAAIFLQISAGFGRVYAEFPPGMAPISCSPTTNRFFDVECRALTVDEIHYITKKIGEAAATAKAAGFDGVQIHAVHEGYLLDQFAISFFNQRTDEYGGSLENRLRFAKEVVEEIKKQCGENYHVSLRFTPKSFIKDWRLGALPGEEFEEKGRDLEEGIEAAKLLEQYGYDSFDVDVGCYDAWFWNHPPMYQEKGLYRKYAKAIKDVVSVPVICAGRMDNPEMASAAIEDGTCDIIGLARPLLADPYYVRKLRADDVAAIRPCLSCHEGCLGRMIHYKQVSCAVNPQCGRERYAQIVPAIEKKRFLVVGGGPAGLEAARVLGLRGHSVVLCEAGDKLGGNLLVGGVPDFKEDDLALAAWYEEQLRRLDNVEVRMNTRVDASVFESGEYDIVIVATGSKPKKFPLGDAEPVVAEDVLLGRVEAADEVAVIGGGLVGCELALWLAQEGRKVTIVEALDDILMLNGPLCPANFEMLRLLLGSLDVKLMCGSQAAGYADGKLQVKAADGTVTEVPCGTVVECVGYAPNNDLYEAGRFATPEVYKLGDASGVANIMMAIWDAFELACNL